MGGVVLVGGGWKGGGGVDWEGVGRVWGRLVGGEEGGEKEL